MATLYNITGRYLDLLNAATEENVDAEALDGALAALDGEIENKVHGGIVVIRELTNRAVSIDAEIKRLAKLKKSAESSLEHIKQYYLDNLAAIGKVKVHTDVGNMAVAKAGGKRPLLIDDESLIPLDFKKSVTQVLIDKDTIRDALERGIEIAGAHLGERSFCLKVY